MFIITIDEESYFDTIIVDGRERAWRNVIHPSILHFCH